MLYVIVDDLPETKTGPLSRSLTIGVLMYDSLMSQKITSNYCIISSNTPPACGGEISYSKLPPPPLKPLDQWNNVDFVLNACVYCMNNGGSKGAPIATTDEYERHIVMKL